MLECGLPSAQFSQHQLFAVCFERFPCGEEENGSEKAMETLADCQDCIHFLLKLFKMMQWDCYWVSPTGKPQVHTHIGLWARHTMIDIQSLSYQTVSMPPSEVILQLWSTGMQTIRNTSWNFSVHNLNLTKPHSLSSGACKIKIFNGGADGLWCLVNVERLTSPLRGAWPEEVIMRSTPVLLSTYDVISQDGVFSLESVVCHFGVWNECRVSERALTGHHAPSRHSLLPRIFDPHAGLSIKTLNGLSGCTWTVHFKKIPLHWLNVILCFLRMHNDINDPQEKSTDMDSCNQLCCFHDYSVLIDKCGLVDGPLSFLGENIKSGNMI